MQFGERLWICPGERDRRCTGCSGRVVSTPVWRLAPALIRPPHYASSGSTLWHSTTRRCSIMAAAPASWRSRHSSSAVPGRPLWTSIRRRCVPLSTTPHSNDVRDRIIVSNHAGGVAGQFDVVVANILAGPLIELAESIAAHVRGGCLLALSGILSEQVGEVLEAYQPWIEFDEPEYREQDGQILGTTKRSKDRGLSDVYPVSRMRSCVSCYGRRSETGRGQSPLRRLWCRIQCTRAPFRRDARHSSQNRSACRT